MSIVTSIGHPDRATWHHCTIFREATRKTVFMQIHPWLLCTWKPTFVKFSLSYCPICAKKCSKITTRRSFECYSASLIIKGREIHEKILLNAFYLCFFSKPQNGWFCTSNVVYHSQSLFLLFKVRKLCNEVILSRYAFQFVSKVIIKKIILPAPQKGKSGVYTRQKLSTHMFFDPQNKNLLPASHRTPLNIE